MAGADDWRDEANDDDRRRGASAARSAVRSKVGPPAVLLIALGLLGLFVDGVALAYSLIEPEGVYAYLKQYILDTTPEGPDQVKKLWDLEDQRKNIRLDTPVNLAGMGFGVVLGAVTLLGGMAMRQVKGYGLAFAGSAAALLPLGGCFCFSTPIGIWALVVLMNPAVKAAFRGEAVRPADPA